MTDLVSRARIGFGFLYSASPGAAALRGGKRAADHSHRTHSAAPGAAPGRRTAFFRGSQFTEESGPPQRLPRALGSGGSRGALKRPRIAAVRETALVRRPHMPGMLGSIATLTHKGASPCPTEGPR